MKHLEKIYDKILNKESLEEKLNLWRKEGKTIVFSNGCFDILHRGLLFTFSCSQAVDKAQFQSIVMAAAIEAGRKAQIIFQLDQPDDHPVNIYHPEGAYLKGLVLKID